MTSALVKEKLHEYIDHADDKKLQAIYVLVENEVEEDRVYDEATLATFRKTSADYLSGKVKGFPLEESMERVKAKLGKKSVTT